MKFAPAWIIQKKRDGNVLSREEIEFFIRGLASGEFAEYQASALLMAIFFKGMTLEETVDLTRAMLESGTRYDFSDMGVPTVDKHSTGGVGDKTSLILAPLAASCGLHVPMMAGRGLGHTGGTVDKLEAIPGFRTQLTRDEFREALKLVGCAIVGQSQEVAPADKKLYALRDVTGTVECIPLIVGSILSKKLAEGTQSLVMDVKVGNGAFMKSKEQARKLAKALIAVAKRLGMSCRVLLTDMNQPLGYSAGHTIEVRECLEILSNRKENKPNELSSCDLKELTLQLCANMLEISGAATSLAQGRKLAQARLEDGSALDKFERMVRNQGGNLQSLPEIDPPTTFEAKTSGYLCEMKTEGLGKLLLALGGGRTQAGDPIDFGVGLTFHKKLGARVKSGEPLVTVHAHSDKKPADLEKLVQNCLVIRSSRKPIAPLVIERF